MLHQPAAPAQLPQLEVPEQVLPQQAASPDLEQVLPQLAALEQVLRRQVDSPGLEQVLLRQAALVLPQLEVTVPLVLPGLQAVVAA